MIKASPFFIDDIENLRMQILSPEHTSKKQAELWKLLMTSARSAPMAFGWFVPFVALITREEQDISNAREVIWVYLDKLDPMSFCSGLQFHFWCFAFPHAKISLYFQWLCTIGAFSSEEERYIAGRLVEYHFTNFYYGLRTKPEPECIDNQVLSLAFSTALVGWLFSQGENPSKMAKIMLRDGLRRLPAVIGDMPLSGYSGEGSSYMDCVNGPAIPLAVEMLERVTGEKNLLFKAFDPNGAKPIQVLRMVAREFMPGGLLLPWDNYGYQLGVRSPIAYAAGKTGEDLFYQVLEKECRWTYDIGTGWAYDDLVWTLIWWPTGKCGESEQNGSWFEPEVGGALLSTSRDRYVMQMWDASAPGIPTRAHVNPNAVIFNGYGFPISADGSPTPGSAHRFQFNDTWRKVDFLQIGGESRYNYGDGCAGAHSILLVDNMESMRAHNDYAQVRFGQFSKERQWIYSDVTPIYQENFKDITMVARKTQLHCDTYFTVEDTFEADLPHWVTSRFLFRPRPVPCDFGVKIQTPEGVILHIFDLLHAGDISTAFAENYPYKPDGCSYTADFSVYGHRIKRLFVVFISTTFSLCTGLTGFKAIPDRNSAYNFLQAYKELSRTETVLPMMLPAHMEAELPSSKTWWYQKRICKKPGRCILKLPAGMHRPLMYINGLKIDLSSFRISGEIIAPHIELPESLSHATEIDVVVRTDVPISHYDGGGDGTIGMFGGMGIGYPIPEEQVESAEYTKGMIYVKTNRKHYTAAYDLR